MGGAEVVGLHVFMVCQHVMYVPVYVARDCCLHDFVALGVFFVLCLFTVHMRVF